MNAPQVARRRSRFLLVILLAAVVISLLVVLTIRAFLTRAVVSYPPRDAEVRNEVTQLTAAVEGFQKDFELDYVPSRLYLREDANYNANHALEQDTVRYLQKMFPRIDLTPTPGVKKHDWTGTGSGTPDNPQRPVKEELEGDQVLVFLVGGISLNGFSTSAADPTASRGPRKGPFYEFDHSRVQCRSGKRFPSYKDVFGTPYAFMSAYKSRNGYNRYGSSDCTSLGVSPYYHSQNADGQPVYCNPESFQIISAGKDGKFGPGGLWTAAVGYSTDTVQPRSWGKDDVSNFHQRLLGN